MKTLSLSLKTVLMLVTVTVFVGLASSCSPKKEPKADPQDIAQFSTGRPSVSVMQFNVENMFDTLHDEGTDDETYLPKSVKDASVELQAKCALQTNEFYKKECLELDWNDEVVDAKLTNVASTILSVEGGRGPDVLFVEEVENLNILNQLRNTKLGAAEYQTMVLIEGFDTRGIDVAVMSRLPLRGKPTLHKIPFVPVNPADQAGMNKSRGILEVPLALPDGSPLTVFALHFPSQSNPRYWREQAVNFLVKLLKDHEGEFTIAGGDFNISTIEEKETSWFNTTLSNVGFVSHIAGCSGCQGSHFYKKEYEFLDALVFSGEFFNKSKASKWSLDVDSISVVRNNPLHLNADGTPLRFDPIKKIGVSDHLPVFARIVQN